MIIVSSQSSSSQVDTVTYVPPTLQSGHNQQGQPQPTQHTSKKISLIKKKSGSKSKVKVDTEVSKAYKVSAYSYKDKQVFMSETVSAAVLDSAYSKTVAGHKWK